ncbi:MAG: hypothetical protein ACXAEU_10285 [Candidatus Hodarchaeales archaeon]
MNYSPLSQGASIILQVEVAKPLSPETRNQLSLRFARGLLAIFS